MRLRCVGRHMSSYAPVREIRTALSARVGRIKQAKRERQKQTHILAQPKLSSSRNTPRRWKESARRRGSKTNICPCVLIQSEEKKRS